MLRYYCDSQIFRYIKNSSPSFNKELFDCFEAVKNDIVFTYSEAHMQDLSVSEESYRNEDLKFMENYVNGNFIDRDYVYRKTEFQMKSPLQAYNSKDYSVSKGTKDPFEIAKEAFKGDELLGEVMNDVMDSLGNIEVPFRNSSDGNKDSRNALQDFGFTGTTVKMKDLMTNFIIKFSDKREFVKLRKVFHKYLKNENYSYENFGMKFDELMANSIFGKKFFEFSEQQLAQDKRNDFFELLKNHFINLEIFGVTTEKTKNGFKQFTFNNLNADASHAYFASYNDYFITDDSGLKLKAMILYKYFNVPTKILTSKEFIAHRFNIVNHKEYMIKDFLTTLKYSLNNSIQVYSNYNFQSQSFINTFSTVHNFFNYTNRLQFIRGDNNHNVITLYCERPSHSNFVLFVELELMSRKLIDLFGNDDEFKGIYTENELDNFNTNTSLRKWTIGEIQVVLTTWDMIEGLNLVIQLNLN